MALSMNFDWPDQACTLIRDTWVGISFAQRTVREWLLRKNKTKPRLRTETFSCELGQWRSCQSVQKGWEMPWLFHLFLHPVSQCCLSLENPEGRKKLWEISHLRDWVVCCLQQNVVMEATFVQEIYSYVFILSFSIGRVNSNFSCSGHRSWTVLVGHGFSVWLLDQGLSVWLLDQGMGPGRKAKHG